MADDDFLAALRAQLLVAAERQRHQQQLDEQDAPVELPSRPRARRNRMLILAAAAVVAVALMSGLLIGRSADPAAADVEVSIDGPDFVVRLTSLETRPDEIVAEARAAGLDVRVREVPVGPSNVGKFIGSSGDQPADFRPIDPESDAFTGFRISKDWPGTLELVLGRAARDGESWIGPTDALQPGEALACEPLLGDPVESVARELEDRDLAVRWFMLPTPAEVDDPGPYGSWHVVSVEALSPHDIRVTATADGSWPFQIERPSFPKAC